MAEPRGPFRPKVKLDRSQVRDQRLNTPVETRAGWDGRQRIGQLPYIFPLTPLQRVNPSIRPRPQPRVRGGSFTLKPIKRIGKKPIIRGGPISPPVGGLLRGAISIGTRLFRGSPVTGPTAAARVSSAAAGPFAGVRVNRPNPIPRRGGATRTL